MFLLNISWTFIELFRFSSNDFLDVKPRVTDLKSMSLTKRFTIFGFDLITKKSIQDLYRVLRL